MPFIRIQAKAGRTVEQKEKLAKTIVNAMEEQGFARREVIHVMFEDLADGDYYPGSEVPKEDK